MSPTNNVNTRRYQRIWEMVCDIPYGYVATYGQIAELAGLPRQARLVGYALSQSPKEMVIPWHRVINAQGKLSFPKDSEPYKKQVGLLSEEGVEVINQKIDLQQFRWQPSLDELLWKPRA